MEKISLDKKLLITDDSVIYLTESFSDFDINKLEFEIANNVAFDIKYSFSYDNQNWSDPIDLTELSDISDFNELMKINNFLPDVYISIWLNKQDLTPRTDTIYIIQNIENTIHSINIVSIKYDDSEINYRIQTFKDLISIYPKWNLYDGQQVTINNWKKNCAAVIWSYGHAAIYFRTEPDDVNHTLANNVTRNVVSIKRIMLGFPNNELPIDRNIFTEWDYALTEDSVSHVVDSTFKQAFGDNKVPNAKDYIYLPILKKLFSVTSVQTGKQYFGVTGWWEVYLAKFEDDETVNMSDSIFDAISDFEDFEDLQKIIDETDNIKIDTVIYADDILEETIDEKKEATHGFSNMLSDSTQYIDLKETEIQREFYDKRLNIVTINPDGNSFPITMYDSGTIEKNVVALTYNLLDNVSVNKKSLILQKNYDISFNYVLNKKFSGNIIELINENLPIVSIQSNRNKLSIVDNFNQQTFNVDYEFLPLEYYHVNIKYDKNLGQFAITIFLLRNRVKKLEYQNLYISNSTNIPQIKFTNLYLYGGAYYIGEIFFTLDNNRILSDYTKPILIMKKFQ